MAQLLLAIIYLAFIGLGLPDGLLGAAWPVAHPELGVPVSSAGAIAMIISAGTITSALHSDRLNRRFGTGLVTLASVGLTAVAIIGFALADAYWMLCAWALPYGLGAGSVDAALNNYVAKHYASRHMSWLHCAWGVGAAIGPIVMGAALTGGYGWHAGYWWVGYAQVALTVMLVASLPVWRRAHPDALGRRRPSAEAGAAAASPGGTSGASGSDTDVAVASSTSTVEGARADGSLPLARVLRIRGAKEVMLTFFCYCAIEQTTGLWGASYLVSTRGMTAEEAAGFASMFFIGITLGRGVSGFFTLKFDDAAMTRIGCAIVAAGLAGMLIPGPALIAQVALVVVGLGCAPIFPAVIHATPIRFGGDLSQAIIGVQMASAYVGTLVIPPAFGLLAQAVSTAWLPAWLAVFLVVMFLMHERTVRVTGA